MDNDLWTEIIITDQLWVNRGRTPVRGKKVKAAEGNGQNESTVSKQYTVPGNAVKMQSS